LRTIVGSVSTALGLGAIVLFIVLVNAPGCSTTASIVYAPAPYRNAGMPPDAFAPNDAAAFEATFHDTARLSPRLADSPSAASKTISSGADVAIIYVTALSGRNANGLFLYSSDADPDESDSLVPLERLRDQLAAMPAKQKKLLILDMGGGPVDWRWGQFTRTANALGTGDAPLGPEWQALLAVPRTAVLTATGPGEPSWQDPAAAQTVFGEYLARGLAGDADRNNDRRVELRELYDYLLMQTQHWVTQNRDSRGQHPQLLVASTDREAMLSAVLSTAKPKSARGTPTAAPPLSRESRAELEKLWDARDEFERQGCAQWHPLARRQLFEHLRRAEQWWLAGQPEGMEPHLKAARGALAELESRNKAGVGKSRVPEAPREVAAASLQPLEVALEQFAPSAVAPKVQADAIALRREFERAAWNGYRSQLWSAPLWPAADAERRLSEDLLFVGGSAELAQSETARAAARRDLLQIDEINRDLSEAIRMHRRLLAKLPDLAWWAAQRVPTEELSGRPSETRRSRLMNRYCEGITQARFDPPSLDAQRKLGNDQHDSQLELIEVDVLVLCEQVRRLGRMLDRELQPNGSAGSEDWRQEWATLKAALTDPERGLEGVAGRLEFHCGRLSDHVDAGEARGDAAQVQYLHWLRLRNALQWAGLSSQSRRRLFADLEQSDRTLQSNLEAASGQMPPAWTGNDWTGVDGCWQALWALQAISFGSSEGEMNPRWVDWKNAVIDPLRQRDLLVKLGQDVRTEYRQRVDRALAVPGDSDALSDALRTLLRSERALRTLHGYDAALFSVERDPVRRLWEFDLGALCVTQSARYLDDFWGKLNAGDLDPWYVVAVEQCLSLADKQNDRAPSTALKTARNEMSQRLKTRQSAGLKVRATDALDLSLATQGKLEVGIEWNEAIPAGVAAVWPQADGGILKLPPGRQSLTPQQLARDFVVSRDTAAEGKVCAEVPVRPKVLFRLRDWGSDEVVSLVNPCPPDFIAWETEPAAAEGKLIVNGLDRRPTLIILDCSLSMTTPLANGQTRFKVATDTLRAALSRLQQEGAKAEPHRVGFMAYGHRMLGKTKNPTWKGEFPADWTQDYEILVPIRKLDQDQATAIRTALDGLNPFGETPLIGATTTAAAELKSGGVIVAITDGVANDDVAGGPRYQRLREILQSRPDLAFHVVAFGINTPGGKNPAEAAQAIKSLTALVNDVKGSIHDAPGGDQLAQAIDRAMKPRPFTLVREIPTRASRQASLGELLGKLPQSRYRVQFPGLQDAEFRIFGGEELQLELDQAGQRILQTRRPLLLSQPARGDSPPLPEPNQFGYVKAVRDKGTNVATLQFCLSRDDRVGVVQRPSEVDIRIAPRGSAQRFSGAWKLAPDESLPTWEFSLRNWPVNARPEVTAFWKLTRTQPDRISKLADLQQTAQPALLPGWPEKGLTVSAEKQAGRVLVRLVADAPSDLRLEDIRIELGTQTQIEEQFVPRPGRHRWKLYEKQRQIVHEFEVGDDFDPAQARIALTSLESLRQGTRTLTSPLLIDKWDDEQ
jgi:hypothetical protein